MVITSRSLEHVYVQPWNRTMRDVYRGLLVLVFHVVKVKIKSKVP